MRRQGGPFRFGTASESMEASEEELAVEAASSEKKASAVYARPAIALGGLGILGFFCSVFPESQSLQLSDRLSL